MLLEPLRVIRLSPLIPGFQIRRLSDEETYSCPQESWVEKQIGDGALVTSRLAAPLPGCHAVSLGEGRIIALVLAPHPCRGSEVLSAASLEPTSRFPVLLFPKALP